MATQHTILVVEDEADSVEAMEKLLCGNGYRVLTAQTCKRAKKIAGENHIDVMIADVGLPDGSGIELIHNLTESYAGLHSIVVTGHAMAPELKQYRPDCQITKPFEFETLLRAIAALIRGGDNAAKRADA